MMGVKLQAPPTSSGDALVALLADPEAAQKRLAELKAAELSANQAHIEANEALVAVTARAEGLEERELALQSRERTVREAAQQVEAQADRANARERELDARARAEFDANVEAVARNEQREASLLAAQKAFGESASQYEAAVSKREAAIAEREAELKACAERVAEMRANLDAKWVELREIANRGI